MDRAGQGGYQPGRGAGRGGYQPGQGAGQYGGQNVNTSPMLRGGQITPMPHYPQPLAAQAGGRGYGAPQRHGQLPPMQGGAAAGGYGAAAGGGGGGYGAAAGGYGAAAGGGGGGYGAAAGGGGGGYGAAAGGYGAAAGGGGGGYDAAQAAWAQQQRQIDELREAGRNWGRGDVPLSGGSAFSASDTRSPAERNRDEKQEFAENLNNHPEFAELKAFIKKNMAEDNTYTVASLREHYNNQVEEKYQVFMSRLKDKKNQGQEFTAVEKMTAQMINIQRQHRRNGGDALPVTFIIKQVQEINAT